MRGYQSDYRGGIDKSPIWHQYPAVCIEKKDNGLFVWQSIIRGKLREVFIAQPGGEEYKVGQHADIRYYGSGAAGFWALVA